MAVFNVACFSQDAFKTDPETGCRYCIYGDKTEYEMCRQSYYLKEQAQIAQQSNLKQTETNSTEASLVGIVEQQNQQISQLLQNSEQNTQQINSLTLVNSALLFLIAVTCIFLAAKYLRHKS